MCWARHLIRHHLMQSSQHPCGMLGWLCVCALSCPTLCDPMDYRERAWFFHWCVCACVLRHFSCIQLFETLPGPSVYGIFQARILEWGAISYSRGSSLPRDWTWVCYTGRQILHHWRHLGSTRMIDSVSWMELRDRNWLPSCQSQSMAGLGFELVLGVELGFSIHFLSWVSVAPGQISAVPLTIL